MNVNDSCDSAMAEREASRRGASSVTRQWADMDEFDAPRLDELAVIAAYAMLASCWDDSIDGIEGA